MVIVKFNGFVDNPGVLNYPGFHDYAGLLADFIIGARILPWGAQCARYMCFSNFLSHYRDHIALKRE